MDPGARTIGWFNQFWPGQVSEAGDAAGRADFTELINCYVTDREIRMFPGSKCVVDPTDPDPGSDGYLALTRDSRRPVAASAAAGNALRERIQSDGSPVGATIRDQVVYAHPRHYWGLHRIRDRHLILGESGLRIEPILDNATGLVVCKLASWDSTSLTTFGATLNLTTLGGGTVATIRVPVGTVFDWMVGLGIQMTSGPANGQSREVLSVDPDTGSGYGEIVLVSGFSAAPTAGNVYIYSNAFTKTVASFKLSPEPGDMTSAAIGNQANKLRSGDVLFVGDVVDDNTADAAALSQRGHYVVEVGWNVSETFVILATHLTGDSVSSSVDAECGRTRGPTGGVNAFGTIGLAIYGGGLGDWFQDDDAITAWWIEDPIDVDASPITKVYASYVANRQRDYGDQSPDNADARTGMTRMVEGHRPIGFGTRVKWGVTRRPTKRAPYRGVTQVSGDRLLMAVPGYGCMFQVPALIPSTSDIATYPLRGAVEGYNDTNLKPRSLGIPKGVLSTPNDPSGWPICSGRANTTGFSLGTYRFAVAYRDDATGEIGQLSEPWDIDCTTIKGAISGTADDTEFGGGGGTHSTTQVAVNNGYYSTASLNGFLLRFTDDTLTVALRGQSQIVTGNTNNPGFNGIIALAGALPAIPANTDVFEILTDGAGFSANLSLLIMHPGYVLAETLALSCMIYMSKVGETALNHIATIQLGDDLPTFPVSYTPGSSSSSVYGLPVTDGANAAAEANELLYLYTLPIILQTTPALYNTRVELPEQRTMPRGASWVRVVRGVPLSGGSIGNTGDKGELAAGVSSSLYDTGNNQQPDELTVQRLAADLTEQDYWNLVANDTIPSSYGGLAIWSWTLFPHPMEVAQLDRVRNCHTEDPTKAGHPSGTGGPVEEAERRYQRWGLVENPHRWDANRSVTREPVWLVMPRGQIQIHEPGLPSVSLGQAKLPIDANKDEDSVAGGEFRGAALLFTQRHTYTMSWAHGPAGAIPLLVSSEFGCIAPNAVDEHDGGTAWISERGIVDFSGTASWGGRRVQEWFRGDTARFLRDSAGMMRQAFSHWDEKREVMLFGLTENRSGSLAITRQGVSTTWAAANDEAKSRFPCDTILAYNPRLRALSEWRPPEELAPHWIDVLSCADGVQRTAALGADGRVRVLDEHFGDENQEPLIVTTTSFGANATVMAVDGAIGQLAANRAGAGTYVRTGMDVVVYDPTTFEIRVRTTAASAQANQLTIADAATWKTGDKVLIGAKSMTIKTAAIRAGGTGAMTVSAVNLAVRLRSRITQGRAGALQQPCWARCWLVYPEHQSGDHGGDSDRKRRERNHRRVLGDFVGFSSATDMVRTLRMNGHRPNPRSFQVELELFGGAHAAVQDLEWELEADRDDG